MALELDWSKCENKTYAQALGFYMMFTGLGWELTEKNAADFYCRIKLHIAVNGPIYYQGGEPVDFTPELIHNAIGLHANVGAETWRKFVNRITDYKKSECLREFYDYKRELENV